MKEKIANIKHLVLDYNGTIAKDGILKEELRSLLPLLAQKYTLHVITADTFGSVQAQLKDFDLTVKILKSADHTSEKETYIQELGKEHCVAFGNGNNDAKMLAKAVIGIAILGDEGCAKETLLACDIVCKSITEAVELLLYPKRVLATLRR